MAVWFGSSAGADKIDTGLGWGRRGLLLLCLDLSSFLLEILEASFRRSQIVLPLKDTVQMVCHGNLHSEKIAKL